MSASQSTIPPFDAWYLVKALAMAIPAIMLGLQISGWIFFIPGAMHGHADFRQLYVAGYMVRTGCGSELFDYAAQKHFQDRLVSKEAIALPFIRPAYQALLFVPFSIFPYRVAYFLFLATNLGLLALCFRLLRPQLSNLVAVWDQLPLALIIAFLPTGAALMQGQDSILLLLLLALAMVRFQDGCDLSAGMLSGLCLFKFQITIPVAILLLCWRRWRCVVGFLLTASAVCLLSLSITGSQQAISYIHSLFSVGTSLRAGGSELHYPIPMKLMMNFHGLINGTAGAFSNLAITIMTLLLSSLFLLWVAFRGNSLERRLQFAVAVASAVLVSFYIFIHDLVVLEIPILVSLENTICKLRRPWSASWLTPVFASILFVAPALILAQAYLVSIPLAVFVCLVVEQSRYSRQP